MDDASVPGDAGGFDDLVETHIRSLAEKLYLHHPLQEIEAEVTALNNLVHAFKHKDELLEKLLEGNATGRERRRIQETLKAMYTMVTDDAEELERLHATSHQLLERAIYLIGRAQLQINEQAHKNSGYSLELCGLCKGLGGSANKPCRPCKGRGTVLVVQPARKCPRCDVGAGLANELCVVCRGSGWVMPASD